MTKIEHSISKLYYSEISYHSIGEVCKITRGRVMSKEYIRKHKGPYPVYSSQTENDGELGTISSYDFDGEYLTWTTDGANAGTVFYRSGKFSITNVCGLLEVCSNSLLTKYLYYILSVEAPKYVNSGMGNPKLMSNVMTNINISIPPIDVQREIIRILDTFNNLAVELATELTARKLQYAYYRDKLLTVDKTSSRIKLSELCDIGDGLHGTPSYDDNGQYYFINGNNLSNGTITLSSQTKRLSQDEYEKIKLSFLNTVLLSINGTIGNVALYGGESIALGKSVAYFNIRSEKLSRKYLFYVLQSSHSMEYFRENSTGTTIKNLGLRALRDYQIPLPSLKVQQRLVEILDHFFTLCTDLTSGLPAEIEARKKQYEYYRDKLLSFTPAD